MNAPIQQMRRELQVLLRGRQISLMEICGTHTVAIFRSGLRSLLPEGLRLISGPGCPVCVTDQGEIDMALSLAERGCVVLTYGDMMRVPGSNGSLSDMKANGAQVETVTSAIDALRAASAAPDRQIVFLGVGFETTTPAAAVLIREADRAGLDNLTVLSLHKRVPPAVRALCDNPALKIDGFLLPGNVTVISGLQEFAFLMNEYHKAAAAAAFEPEEILAAILDMTRQIVQQRPRLSAYRLHDSDRDGNHAAKKLIEEVFQPCDASWRGLGSIKNSGLSIRERYAHFDAMRRFELTVPPAKDNGCQCGEVLSGLITPPECRLYGTACTPLTPVGPCMVSGEGTCGAWYKYQR